MYPLLNMFNINNYKENKHILYHTILKRTVTVGLMWINLIKLKKNVTPRSYYYDLEYHNSDN